MVVDPITLARVQCDVAVELCVATKKNGPFNSAHEGLAVLWEEFEELKEEVFKKAKERDIDNMKQEAIQVGAMAMRFLIDIVYPLEDAVSEPAPTKEKQ